MSKSNDTANKMHETDVEFISVLSNEDTLYTKNIKHATVPLITEELILYRSKCDIDDIPDVARGMTWTDPFYDVNDPNNSTTTKNNNDIIAAFDIDRTLYDRSTFAIMKWFFLIPMFCVVPISAIIFIFGGMLNVLYSFSLYLIYGVFLLTIYCTVDCQRHEKKARLKRTHIAISTRGIYIDEVDTPGSNNLMSRTRIKYDEITKCQVISEFNLIFRTMYYKVTVNTKFDFPIKNDKGDHIGFYPKHIIEGIPNQQKFVDIVEAMMERHAHCVTPLPAVVVNTAVEESNKTDMTSGLV